MALLASDSTAGQVRLELESPGPQRVLHVAPDPRGGWVVEAANHRLAASSYSSREEACREAGAYVAHGWRVVVHAHPAAESCTPAG